jgi:hypothetical protein
LCVTELADEVGMKPQAVSSQLQRLSAPGEPVDGTLGRCVAGSCCSPPRLRPLARGSAHGKAVA